MAGYSGYSMSNNAVAAYEDGLVPASKIPGIPAALVKSYCYPSEWHHTSCQFNKTNFYNVDKVLATFGKISHKEFEADQGAIEALKSFKAKASKTTVHADCRVKWLEWSGSRNHAKCSEREELGATVEIKGQTATIALTDGSTLVKRLGTKGLEIQPGYTAFCKASEKKKESSLDPADIPAQVELAAEYLKAHVQVTINPDLLSCSSLRRAEHESRVQECEIAMITAFGEENDLDANETFSFCEKLSKRVYKAISAKYNVCKMKRVKSKAK